MAAKKVHSTEPCSLGTMEEVQQIFNTFDKNRDGKISLSELDDVLKALGSETSPEELARIMTEIDSDGDGFIDVHEFAEFHRSGAGNDGKPSAAANSTSKELRDAFDLYDLDKNGLISAKELHSVLRRLGEKCSLGDCSKMIRSVDADGDGSVNFEEFKKMMTRA